MAYARLLAKALLHVFSFFLSMLSYRDTWRPTERSINLPTEKKLSEKKNYRKFFYRIQVLLIYGGLRYFAKIVRYFNSITILIVLLYFALSVMPTVTEGLLRDEILKFKRNLLPICYEK